MGRLLLPFPFDDVDWLMGAKLSILVKVLSEVVFLLIGVALLYLPVFLGRECLWKA